MRLSATIYRIPWSTAILIVLLLSRGTGSTGSGLKEPSEDDIKMQSRNVAALIKDFDRLALPALGGEKVITGHSGSVGSALNLPAPKAIIEERHDIQKLRDALNSKDRTPVPLPDNFKLSPKLVNGLTLDGAKTFWFQELQGSSISEEERLEKRLNGRKRPFVGDEERAKPSGTTPPKSTTQSATFTNIQSLESTSTTPHSLLAEFGVGLDPSTPIGRIYIILSKTQLGEDLVRYYNELSEQGRQLDLKTLNFTLKMLEKLAGKDEKAINKKHSIINYMRS
ncbi:hypothetical protein PSACC_01724 [Paramicrosporidium saccamoebae]|uniref:Uncharacterized protein n=1 Tax=Paramicrosporidium saccamoebae TaxID=1246581 RepID=A0A2H9TL19_9FUNG|nr:hypothetical protein PSACC_01724 [Paramicrosporidium saccamoebae]